MLDENGKLHPPTAIRSLIRTFEGLSEDAPV